MRHILSLDYPVTRTYPGRFFAPVAFGGAFVVLLSLATINGVSITDFYSSRLIHPKRRWRAMKL
jgi:hypothetical protein